MSACVSPDKSASKPNVMPRPALQADTADNTTAETDTAALVSKELRLRARGAMLEGELLQANRLLNRALRLNPSDAKIYLLLSKVRILENKFLQAKQFANKGLALSANQETIEALITVLDEAQDAIDNASGEKAPLPET